MRTTPTIRPEIAIRPNINVTPLIDILLVMLVIFLAAVTLTQQAIEAQLPAETKRTSESTNPSQIMIQLSADRRVSVNQQPLTSEQLGPFLRRLYRTRTDKTIYIAAAGSLPYSAIVDVMDAAKGAGVDRVGVITEGMRRSAGVKP